MNQKITVIIMVAAVVLLGTGFVLYKSWTPVVNIAQKTEEPVKPSETIEPIDPSIDVTITKSKVKDNTVVLSLKGLGGKVLMVAYELSYDSQGIVQGVTSKPLDVSGKDAFVRDDIYLGTCSRNVCRPHPGVKSVSVVLELTNANGTKSQFSKDFPL